MNIRMNDKSVMLTNNNEIIKNNSLVEDVIGLLIIQEKQYSDYVELNIKTLSKISDLLSNENMNETSKNILAKYYISHLIKSLNELHEVIK